MRLPGGEDRPDDPYDAYDPYDVVEEDRRRDRRALLVVLVVLLLLVGGAYAAGFALTSDRLPRGSRVGIGSLQLGYYDPAGQLHYAGAVGTGFTDAQLAEWLARLQPLAAPPPAGLLVAGDPIDPTTQWVTPRYVIEAAFTAWSGAGRLRHPVHLGLRESHRRRQLDLLCRMVCDGIPREDPLLVAGDFNDWRRKAHSVLERCAGLREVFVHAHGSAARTFPARFPALQLDRIYVRNAQVHAPMVLPRRPWSHLSEHAPLAAEISL